MSQGKTSKNKLSSKLIHHSERTAGESAKVPKGLRKEAALVSTYLNNLCNWMLVYFNADTGTPQLPGSPDLKMLDSLSLPCRALRECILKAHKEKGSRFPKKSLSRDPSRTSHRYPQLQTEPIQPLSPDTEDIQSLKRKLEFLQAECISASAYLRHALEEAERTGLSSMTECSESVTGYAKRVQALVTSLCSQSLRTSTFSPARKGARHCRQFSDLSSSKTTNYPRLADLLARVLYPLAVKARQLLSLNQFYSRFFRSVFRVLKEEKQKVTLSLGLTASGPKVNRFRVWGFVAVATLRLQKVLRPGEACTVFGLKIRPLTEAIDLRACGVPTVQNVHSLLMQLKETSNEQQLGSLNLNSALYRLHRLAQVKEIKQFLCDVNNLIKLLMAETSELQDKTYSASVQ